MRAIWSMILKRAAMVGASVGVLALGVFALVVLPGFRREPVEARPEQPRVPVEVVAVEPEDVRVLIEGFGAVNALEVVRVAAEVGGRIVETHPDLDVGEVIPEGETLFVIDPRTYEAQVKTAEAALAQARSALARLKLQYETDRQRVATLRRSRDLARAEFERLQTLFEQDDVGTRSGVEQSERAYNQAQDQLDIMNRTLETYPVQLEEAESGIASAQARLEQARIDLERTSVTAPFDARLKEVAVETGQFVAPGTYAVTIANDSVLELSVPLNSREARNWLRFREPGAGHDVAWFAGVEPVDVAIQWTEDDQHTWTGTLHRVEAFDPDTRTLTVAVRVSGEQALSTSGDALPLVDGMFCRVVIPGKTMDGVFRLPRSAVTFDGDVYVAEDGRLKTRPVELVNEQEGYAFVGAGLEPGDRVIVTRLVDPLENTLLDVTTPEPPAAPGEAVELPGGEARP